LAVPCNVQAAVVHLGSPAFMVHVEELMGMSK
jgi:hypothetical protein